MIEVTFDLSSDFSLPPDSGGAYDMVLLGVGSYDPPITKLRADLMDSFWAFGLGKFPHVIREPDPEDPCTLADGTWRKSFWQSPLPASDGAEASSDREFVRVDDMFELVAKSSTIVR